MRGNTKEAFIPRFAPKKLSVPDPRQLQATMPEKATLIEATSGGAQVNSGGGGGGPGCPCAGGAALVLFGFSCNPNFSTSVSV
jgi:hypothetical protein